MFKFYTIDLCTFQYNIMNWSTTYISPTRRWITVSFISNGTTAVSQIVYQLFISAMWNSGRPVTMKPLHCFNQRILSGFLKEITEENGWWLRVQKLNDRNLRETHKSTEMHTCVITCFPHFRTFIGLTEDA